jgi:IclR family acetate operon transcriptional repressor
MRNGPDPADGNSAAGEVGVLNKALDLIEAMATAEHLTVAELSASSGVNKAAAYRILHTLERRGYVARETNKVRRYSLGPAFRSLTRDNGSPRNLLLAARPVLRHLWEEYGETVNLGVMAQDRVLYLDILESEQGLRTTVTVGSLDQPHCTALGKAMLAALPSSEAQAILMRTERTERTPRTITAIPDLVAELGRIAERGYALDDEENESGARCVAGAIIDAEGRPSGALSVSGPAWRLPDETVERIGQYLVRACADLGANLH